MRLGVAAFAALMLAVVLGVLPFAELAQHIPIVKTGNHLRLVVILMLCLALLAGWGLDDLTRREIPRAQDRARHRARPAGRPGARAGRPRRACRGAARRRR